MNNCVRLQIGKMNLVVPYIAVILQMCGIMLNMVDSCAEESGKIPHSTGTVYEMVRYGHYVEFDCCCCKGNSVTWTKWSNESNQWQRYVPDRSNVRLLDGNRLLSVQSSEFEDTGLYKCSVRNGSTVLHVKTFHLDVVACDELARGPYPIAPLPCAETVTHQGDMLTLQCSGYFGCSDGGDVRIVTWFVSFDRQKKDNWVKAESADTRYKQIDYQLDGNTVKGSSLTILGVSATDFSRKFMCLLASPQQIHGQTKLVVTLEPNKSNQMTSLEASFSYLIALIGASFVACISVIINIIVIMVKKRDAKGQSQRNKDIGRLWNPVEVKEVYVEDT